MMILEARKILLCMIGVSNFLLIVGCMNSAAQHPFSDPDNDGNWELNHHISDEFDETELNADKWYVQGENAHYENNFKGRAPSQFTPNNISVADGFFTISSKWEPDFEFLNESMGGLQYGKTAPITTGAIISKAKFLYGYMEIRCKAADGPISSSFWTTGKGGELDVFEHYGQNKKSPNSAKRYHTSFHDWRNNKSETWGKRIWTNEHYLNFRVADDFHVYGLEWDKDYIKIFIDGKLIRCITKSEIGEKWVMNNEQKIWVDSEIFPWELKSDQISQSDFPGEGRKYIVDYVRIWQKQSKGEGCESRTNLISNAGFETELSPWKSTGTVSIATNDKLDGNSAAKLGGLGVVEQVVNVRPNTTYILSAWVKLPGTNMTNIWHNASIGVKEYGEEEFSVRYFRPEYTHLSLQFKTGNTNKATVFFKNTNASHLAYADRFELVELSSSEEDELTKVKNQSFDFNVKIRPNPVKDYFTVSLEKAARTVTASLLNMEGRTIITKNFKKKDIRFATNKLENGTYFLHLREGTKKSIHKVIVQ